MSDACSRRAKTALSRAVFSVLAIALLSAACDSGQPATLNAFGNPETLAPRPTDAAITPEDLQTRLYIFADDSMMGRQTGREGNMKGTAYIARELERLGIEPAGDDGTYFQRLPYVVRKYTDASTLTVDGEPLTWLTDFVAAPGNAPPLPIEEVEVVYGGVIGDTANAITADQARGRLVLLAPNPEGRRMFRFGRGRSGAAAVNPLAEAVAIATVDLDDTPPEDRGFINDPPGRVNRNPDAPPQPGPATLRFTAAAAERLLGGPLQDMAPGATGGTVTATLDYVEEPVPDYGRNVVGILRGSDPELAGQYVAIGAHNDHVGYSVSPVDHDSLKAFNAAVLAARMQGSELVNISPEERAAIQVNIDSLRAIRPARMDSIRNGADDDGSGSIAVLEIAEAFAKAPEPPRRSILFLWYTGEEGGLTGSRWFVDHPTVPRDSIVTNINIDMIGRGRATDIPGGGDNYLGVIGSKRLSVELGQMVIEVNDRQPTPLDLDYRMDEPISWPGYNNLYNRSDHANFARVGIPIVFFFSGLHADYHQVTDEAQYIDYPHYSRITNYINDLMVELANRDRRPAIDQVSAENR